MVRCKLLKGLNPLFKLIEVGWGARKVGHSTYSLRDIARVREMFASTRRTEAITGKRQAAYKN